MFLICSPISQYIFNYRLPQFKVDGGQLNSNDLVISNAYRLLDVVSLEYVEFQRRCGYN